MLRPKASILYNLHERGSLREQRNRKGPAKLVLACIRMLIRRHTSLGWQGNSSPEQTRKRENACYSTRSGFLE